MKPFQKSRRIAKSQLANSKLKQVVNLILAIFLVSISSVDWVHAEFWFEDFTDGEISDSGIDWVLSSLSSSSSYGLELNAPIGNAAGFAVADSSVDRQGWSIRTQARLLQAHGGLGAGTDDRGSEDAVHQADRGGEAGDSGGAGGVGGHVEAGGRVCDAA